ncbi:SMP-30/gluconolactonase/LRE family protein [uncultured Hoeflea sp.]|uniref:SMP-30/gluconolactonase/LRE family protein n=1 Tax=uncultured Hoeflea sp. TaxID=538666 RepID=UPI0030D8F880|tara:strand:- start:318 stop:1226 length:909 start_codon:yes stop_codon:yes gene_type:complete
MTGLYDVIRPEFNALVLQNVGLTKLSSGHMWTEGPVWVPAHQCLYFSDIPNERILRWTPDGSVTPLRNSSNFTNGNTLDAQGRLVSCQHGTRSVVRTEHDGSILTLAHSFDGKRLNSPNDVVVKSDGSIWFTDPTYGIMGNYEGNRAVPEQPLKNVFRLDPDSGELDSVVSDFCQPNGLAFSPDESVLYVAESGRSHQEDIPAVVRAFDVQGGKTLANSRIFATISAGLPDGIRVDALGNLWVSSADSVRCFSSEGELLGRILVPEVVSNLTFGGPRNTHLFITATTSVYAIHVNVEAPRWI